jgi:CBS domain-containing protein
MRARDFIEIDVLSVRPNETVGAAAQVMIRHGRSGLPVLAEDGSLLGVVGELDLLHLLVPDYLASLADLRFVPEDISPGVCSLDDVCQVLVQQAMGEAEAHTVDEGDPILEVVRLMVKDRLPYVCVTQDGRFVAMLEARQLVRRIAEASLAGDGGS